METEELLNNYKEVRECEYKGRHYLARDNGAICRLPKKGSLPSKLDNVWSFGVKNPDNGYMMFTGNIRVHQVICTAFHGQEPQSHMVVDHIDTNRCNNRPENLRWLTRLENALNNEVTRKKIIALCGSIEAFIENPTIIRTKALSPNVEWMRTVTKEEAQACKKHLDEWVSRDTPQKASGNNIGEWIFSDFEKERENNWNKGWESLGHDPSMAHQNNIREFLLKQELKAEHELKKSLTPGAKQLNWKTPTEFLLCPIEGQERTLKAYLNNLEKGKIFARAYWGDCGAVLDCGINEEENALYVLTQKDGDEIKPWALCRITLQDDCFVHESKGTFFKEDGGRKYFTLAMGREWTGGDVFDDGC